MDLTTLDGKTAAEGGLVVHLEHPGTGEPLYDNGEAVTWSILGSDSAKVRSFDKAASKRNFDRASKRGTLYDLDAAESNRIGRLVVASTDFTHIELDGQKLDFSEVNARRVLSDERFVWLVEQLEKKIGDRGNFFGNASKP